MQHFVVLQIAHTNMKATPPKFPNKQNHSYLQPSSFRCQSFWWKMYENDTSFIDL